MPQPYSTLPPKFQELGMDVFTEIKAPIPMLGPSDIELPLSGPSNSEIMEKLQAIERKLDLIFGNSVLIKGRFVDIA